MKSKFYRKVLKNGMTILFEKRDIPVVSVCFAVRAGGVNEAEKEKGISHFIEHMLYKGTKTRSEKQIAHEIEKNGGELNGFTGEEITGYWVKISSDKLKTALSVLSDIIKNSVFDEKELEKERLVIFEEIKYYKDNPLKHIFDEILKTLYTGTMAMNLAGTVESMKSIDRKKLLLKFKEIYSPKNLILCVVGDANIDEIVNFAEKNFVAHNVGSIPEQQFEFKNEEKIEKRKGIDQANLVFAYHVPLANDKKHYAAYVLSALMAEGLSSRLFIEIRAKRNLAYAVKGSSDISKRFAYNLIYVGCAPENVEKIKKLILKEFEKVGSDLDEKELREIKEQLIGHHNISQEDSRDQMVGLLSYEITGDAGELYKFEKNIKGVKLSDVKNLSKKAYKNHSFFALIPE